jgi:hypothetical protein
VLNVEKYSATEALRDGCRVEIRALRPDDRADLLAAVGRASAQSLYRRFFGLKRSFTEEEAAFFVNVDFVNHVALVALIDEGGRSVIAGGGIWWCDACSRLCEHDGTTLQPPTPVGKRPLSPMLATGSISNLATASEPWRGQPRRRCL